MNAPGGYAADCDQGSPVATDEEPPGPLDLTSSIFSTDPTCGGEIVSVDTTRSYSSDFRPTLAAVATGSRLVVARNYANGYTATGPAEFVAEARGERLSRILATDDQCANLRLQAAAFSKHLRYASGTTGAGSRGIAFARSRSSRTCCGCRDEEREALVQGGTMLPVGITPYYMSLLDEDDPRQPLAPHRRADAQ